MEVILTENYPSLGYVGDRIQVRNGYARNFLLPRGIAVEASSHNARLLKHKMDGINAKKARLKAEAEAQCKALEAVSLEFKLKFGAQGKSFGSITIGDVEAALKERGFTLDKKQIRFPEAIRKAGAHRVQVKLHADVTANIPMQVISEQTEPKRAAAAEGEAGEAKPEKKKRSKKAAAEGEAAAPAEATEETPPAE